VTPAPKTDTAGFRDRLRAIIFESETRVGRLFDTVLLVAILASVAVVLLESVPSIRARHPGLLVGLEWGFTLLFTFEYALRLYSLREPLRYARSFFGVVDLLAILPTYLSLLLPGAQSFLVIRVLRLMRVFRVFKIAAYVDESTILWRAVRDSRRKVAIFLFAIFNVVVIIGAAMHVIEGPQNGFTDIPTSIYWTVVTLTTVGYGDVAPQTPLGRAFAVFVMLLGYGIIAVPTGLVTAELVRAARPAVSTQACPACGAEGHPVGARHCHRCGAGL